MHGSTSVCAHPQHPQHTYTNIHLTDTAHIAQQPDISIPFCFYMFYHTTCTTCTTCFLFDFSMSKKLQKYFCICFRAKVNDLSDLSEKEPGSWRHQHGHNLNSAAQEDGKKYENRNRTGIAPWDHCQICCHEAMAEIFDEVPQVPMQARKECLTCV